MFVYCFNAFLLNFLGHTQDVFFKTPLKYVIWIIIVIYSQY